MVRAEEVPLQGGHLRPPKPASSRVHYDSLFLAPTDMLLNSNRYRYRSRSLEMLERPVLKIHTGTLSHSDFSPFGTGFFTWYKDLLFSAMEEREACF